jgi:hypothetical protein
MLWVRLLSTIHLALSPPRSQKKHVAHHRLLIWRFVSLVGDATWRPQRRRERRSDPAWRTSTSRHLITCVSYTGQRTYYYDCTRIVYVVWGWRRVLVVRKKRRYSGTPPLAAESWVPVALFNLKGARASVSAGSGRVGVSANLVSARVKG